VEVELRALVLPQEEMEEQVAAEVAQTEQLEESLELVVALRLMLEETQRFQGQIALEAAAGQIQAVVAEQWAYPLKTAAQVVLAL
jgi:hypothetical protein